MLLGSCCPGDDVHSDVCQLFLQAESVLGWRPQFGLVDGLRDSYEKDFGRGTMRKEADFTADDVVLQAVKH